MDLWGIMNESKKAPPSNIGSKVKEQYQMRVKKSMVNIVLNLADNQFA